MSLYKIKYGANTYHFDKCDIVNMCFEDDPENIHEVTLTKNNQFVAGFMVSGCDAERLKSKYLK